MRIAPGPGAGAGEPSRRYVSGVRCPYCSEDSDKVVDSRASVDGDAIRRRRECLECGRRFTTYERLEPIPLTVRKRSGATQPFARDKLARGITQAVAGRAVASEAVEAMATDLAVWAESQGPEISSDAIGVAVLERLRALDPVSYLRFASVYKGFEDLADFEAEVVELQKTTAPKTVVGPAVVPNSPEPERA
jgi:transcriptional repressor NrdR